MHALAFLALTLAVPVRPDTAPPAEKPALTPTVLGDWQVISLVTGGRNGGGGGDDSIGDVFTFTLTEILVAKKGVRAMEGDATYTIDWMKKPATIDLAPKARADFMIRGILRLEGEMLTICFTMNPDRGRPRDFSVLPDAMTAIVQLKRLTK